MHRAGADTFGAPWPGFIADLPMDNSPTRDWADFYVTRRVLPFVRQARVVLSAGDATLVERALERVSEVAGAVECPGPRASAGRGVALHQLAVHVAIYGHSYRGQLVAAAERVVRM